MAVHQPHPKCDTCHKSLYKAPDVGKKVSPDDPYQYCRNQSCEQYCYRPEPAEEAPEPEAAEPTPAPAPAPPAEASTRTPARVRRRARPAAEAPPLDPAAVEQSISIHVARGRIKAILAQVTEGKQRLAISIVLAIINQELGCHAGANVLIDELGLEKYGLEKFPDGVDASQEEVAASDASTG